MNRRSDLGNFSREKFPASVYLCYFLRVCVHSYYTTPVGSDILRCMITGQRCDNAALWDEIVHDLDGHPLQLWGWGELKASHGWKAHRILFVDDEERVAGAAQVLSKTLPGPFKRLNYVPRGPIWHVGDEQAIMDALARYVHQHLPGTILTIEPDDDEIPVVEGWRVSPNTILIPRTLILDLQKGEQDLLNEMSKKTRQYIRKSGREELQIRRLRRPEDIAKCLTIYKQTAQRAGFALHDDLYYQDLHTLMGDSSIVFATFHGEKPVAFLWLVISKKTAFELYGGMNDEGQELRANYMLKWHAITKCKEWGIDRYDMNGLLNDGVSTFKQSFSDHEDMLVGTYDYPLSKLYNVWTKGLPAAKKVLRKVKSLRK